MQFITYIPLIGSTKFTNMQFAVLTLPTITTYYMFRPSLRQHSATQLVPKSQTIARNTCSVAVLVKNLETRMNQFIQYLLSNCYTIYIFVFKHLIPLRECIFLCLNQDIRFISDQTVLQTNYILLEQYYFIAIIY